MGMVCFTFLQVLAQKKVPYTFQYEADSVQQGQLKKVTEINYPNTTSLRLYFEETKLGKESYLLLESSDGAQQKLDGEALKNWSNSSAYFNGGTVKISVYQSLGEPLVTFKLKEVKVNDGQIGQSTRQTQARKVTTKSATSSSAGEISMEEMPYAAAIGRLTNGSRVGGAGWIAPNGAIVTSRQGYKLISEGFDIIEFNVPLSNQDGSVNHPAPEDQYPLKVDEAIFTSREVHVKRVYWSVWSSHYLLSTLGFAVIEALPNSTGQKPGERQQAYFRIAQNPGESTVESTDINIDVFSYTGLFDIYPASPYSYNFALQMRPSVLLEVKDHVQKYTPDLDEILIYNLYGQDIHWEDVDWSHTGGPVTYQNSNVAIGVNEEVNWDLGPSIGNGFRHDNFRNSLNNFFTSNVVYVDADGLYDNGATGEVHKPYTQIADGIGQAADDAIVYIAKGSYNESVTINTPMTLKAPVGVVKIGTSEDVDFNARKATLPREFFMEHEADDLSSKAEETENSFGLKSFPNPFASTTEINYSLSEPTMVQVNVYDKLGNKVRSLVQESQGPGIHSVVWDGNHQNGRQATPGLYVIRIETALKSTAVKVIKN